MLKKKKSAGKNLFFPPDVSLCFFSHYKGLHTNSFLPSLSPVCPVSSVSLILYLSASSCVHRLAAPRWIRDLSDRQIKYTATNREGVCRYSASLYSSACAFSVQILSATLCSNRMPLYRALHEVGQREHVAWIPNVEVGHAAVGTWWHPNRECSPLTRGLLWSFHTGGKQSLRHSGKTLVGKVKNPTISRMFGKVHL